MRLLHVHKDSAGKAKRLRWLLQADFDVKHGFVPMFGEQVNSPWDEAYVVVKDERVLAAIRFDRKDGRTILAGGTWVAPDQRGSGLARLLWARVLRGVKAVEVTTVSRGGRGLVARLREQYRRVSWAVSVD